MDCCGKKSRIIDRLIKIEFGIEMCVECFYNYTEKCKCGNEVTGQELLFFICHAPYGHHSGQRMCLKCCDKIAISKCYCRRDITLFARIVYDGLNIYYNHCFKCFKNDVIEYCRCNGIIDGRTTIKNKINGKKNLCSKCN